MSFLRCFFVAAAIPLLALLLLGIYLQPLSGDLTRLGNYSERSWGWNRDQPAIQVRKNDPRGDARVLVIGDSFSERNLWQSVATDRLGLPFLTFHWSDIGDPSCLLAAVAALKHRYPGAQAVVVQVVERSFVRRFDPADARTANCVASPETSIHPREESSPIRRSRYTDPMPDPIYAMRALFSDWRGRQQTTASGQTSIAPLDRADLFSNHSSGELLFINEDFAKDQWRKEQIDRSISKMQQLSELGKALGVAVIFAVVPDKTTIYSPFLARGTLARAPTDLWSALDAAGVAVVDLKARFQEEAGSSVDFYLPDDSHLGSRGYIAMGQAIANAVARLLAH